MKCILTVLLLASFVLVGCKKSEADGKAECLTNLRQIHAAKESWALEEKKLDGALVSETDISGGGGKHITGQINGKGKEDVSCPSGGKYTVNAIGQKPMCSMASHNQW